VLLVDLNGRLGVRKEFRNRGRFVQELEALLHLEAKNCPVPRLMNVDWDKGSITITFVPGDVVRELLAEAGADIRDRATDGSYTREVDRQRIRNGRELVPRVLADSDIEDVAAGLEAIHAAGFVLEDVKFGNIILKTPGGEPVFVDLERALPVASLPPWLADHLRQIDVRKFREHFGR
jgi:tRNA A-37 threonylcarbamoyl transferase component Bud32